MDTPDLNCSVDSFDTAAIKGDKLYFIGKAIKDINNSSEDNCCNLYCFDMTKKKLYDCGQLIKGFGSSADILGEYNGGLYLSAACNSGEFESKVFTEEYFAMTPEEQAELFEKEKEERAKLRVAEYMKLDYLTDGLEKVDIPAKQDSVYVGGGCLFYVDKDSGENILCCESSASVIDCCLTSGRVVNGIAFMTDTLTAFDLTKMQTLKFNEANITREDVVLDFRNGNYIIRNIISGSYRIVSGEDMFLTE